MKKSKGLYPCASYRAYFADGSVTQMGFWNDSSKPIDYIRGARVCALAGWQNPALQDRLSNSGTPVTADLIFAPRKPADWLGEGDKKVIDGYLFREGQLLGRDPRMSGPAKYQCDPMPDLDSRAKRAPRQSMQDLKELIKRVLANEAAAIEEARRMIA